MFSSEVGQFECFDEDDNDDDLIGEFTTTFAELEDSHAKLFEVDQTCQALIDLVV